MSIRPSKEHVYAWVVKVWIVLLGIWFIVGAIYLLAKAFGVQYEFIDGMQNRVSFLLVMIISFFLTAAVVSATIKFLSRNTELVMTDTGVTVYSGLIGKKEVSLNFSDIREAHTVPGSLSMVDDLFDVDNIIVHGPKTVTIDGLKNGEKLAREISDRANAAKSPQAKGPTVEQLEQQIRMLKEEITQLRLERATWMEKKEEKKEEGKRKPRFLKPFEEGI